MCGILIYSTTKNSTTKITKKKNKKKSKKIKAKSFSTEKSLAFEKAGVEVCVCMYALDLISHPLNQTNGWDKFCATVSMCDEKSAIIRSVSQRRGCSTKKVYAFRMSDA